MHPLVYAFIPLIGWGFGDFFIQKTTRRSGAIATLWYICGFSTILLFPFFGLDALKLDAATFLGLCTLGVVIFAYALVLFKAFEVGKLSVTEAVVSFELPITVGISVFAYRESLTAVQMCLFLLICIGIFLASAKYIHHFKNHKNWLEKGVALAFVGAVLSAFTNVYVGLASANVDPFLVIWFTHAFLFVLCTGILFLQRGVKAAAAGILRRPATILATAFFDNLAWFGYAYATSVSPISLTVMISESYIVLAALLGYIYGHEKLKSHQKIGALIALPSTVLLAYLA